MDAAPAPPSTQAAHRIIVIGAGLAGLCAAHELKAKGHRVILIEASSRPGGRVQTLRQAFADDLYADAGAMVFADVNTLVRKYVSAFNLPIRVVPPQSTLYHLHGSQFVEGLTPKAEWPDSLALTPAERALTPDALFAKYFVEGVLSGPANPLDPSWPPDTLKQYDAMSGLQFLQSRGASPAAIEVFQASMFAQYGDGLASVSALSILAIVSMTLGVKLAYWIAGGSDLLPRAFAAGLSDDIRYGTSAIHVVDEGPRVHVTATKGGKPRTYTAEYCVCAVPYPVLKAVMITPISPVKQQIINELGNTSVVRTFLQFATRFWENTDESGTGFTDLPIGSVYSAYPFTAQRGVLETYATGDPARQMAAMSEAERLQFALNHITTLFPDAADHYEHGASKCWDLDPWAAGAYAYFKPHQLTTFLPHLAAPEGRIYFAGDCTTPLPGWLEAALTSGSRAAAAIDAAIKA